MAWSVAGLLIVAAIWLARRAEPALPTATAETVARAPAVPAQSVPASRARVDAPVPASAVAHLANDPRCVIKDPPKTISADASADSGSPVPAPAVDPRAQASRARLLARLAGSADPYANAVAVWLDVDVESDEAHLAGRERKLASMAASTRDPRLYSLALRSCWRHPAHPCDPGLSARRWTELEPANALPWLMMFDEAAERGDLSGMHEAMFHVTQARRLAERADAPLQPILDAASGDVDSLVAARALAERAIGISAAEVGTYGVTACSRATTANANVWQQCLGLADLITRRSDSLLAISLGETLHQRLTGEPKSAERAAALDRMLKAQAALLAASNCDELRDELAVLRRMAIEGEAAVLQDLAR
ncbi:hypothetical protein [Scleromatobacter humisilvae]|uniref:Uncharacterized protein n=1 Tax=Scleromatobacter humisilvae TaxID=2897159 RepID=A0A9X1YPQ5_9BURK|nr:hypothetical protein [Scleromatobacter humisilvae]MCK9688813.1 hypothetical protein [Scleromatobacter humisilvae]